MKQKDRDTWKCEIYVHIKKKAQKAKVQGQRPADIEYNTLNYIAAVCCSVVENLPSILKALVYPEKHRHTESQTHVYLLTVT